mmetsp:Transcript_637/g.1817  ORF Transcript_637/g.1817 Transcript_637/m.1817 type:complete len:364 (+) Transcript_637:393-1484(+)
MFMNLSLYANFRIGCNPFLVSTGDRAHVDNCTPEIPSSSSSSRIAHRAYGSNCVCPSSSSHFMKSSAVCTPLVHTSYIPGHTSFFSLRFVDSTERCLPGGAKLKSLLRVDLVVVVLASRSSTPFLCGVCASSTKGTARHKSLRSNSRYASATLASVVQSPSSSSSSSSAEEEKTRSSKVPNFQQRCEMCEKQFLTPGDEGSSSGRVKVKRIELEATDWKRKVTGDARTTIIGTYELLEYLKRNDKKEKDIESRNIEYTFVMGRDAFDDLITGKWIRGDEILKTTNIVVVPRITSTTPTRAINEMSTTFSKETKSVVFLENITDLGNVSSSSVRESIKNGTKPTVIEELNPLVAKYIEENSLYE